MLDCRPMPNPLWADTLRGSTGLDKPVCDFFVCFPETLEQFLEVTETIVRQSIEQYKRDGRDHLQVAFGCTGNAPAAKRSGCLSAKREPRRGRKGPRQHRSVYFAERLARRLAIIDGIEVEIVHSAKPYWKIETGGNEQ